MSEQRTSRSVRRDGMPNIVGTTEMALIAVMQTSLKLSKQNFISMGTLRRSHLRKSEASQWFSTTSIKSKIVDW
jgi:hypothetical protein